MAEGRPSAGREMNIDRYDKHWFVNKQTAREYICSKCRYVLKDPQQIVTCGHQFCRSCLPREVKKCPACDQDVKPNEVFADQAAKKKVLALVIRCPSKHPCKWKGSLEKFVQKHKNECPLHLVKCENEGCGVLVRREELEKHMQDECQHRETDCQHCGERMTLAEEKEHLNCHGCNTRDGLETHCYKNTTHLWWLTFMQKYSHRHTHNEKDCKRIPVECQLCRNEVPREDLQNHIDEECEKTIIECRFKDVGCEDQVERGELRQHEADKINEHLSKAVTVIIHLRREKQGMTEKTHELQELNTQLAQELRDLHETQETRVNKVESDLNDFKEFGQLRLETVQKATERNFETSALSGQRNMELQNSLSSIKEELTMMNSVVIPGIQATCQSSKAEDKRLAETDDKLQKMIAHSYKKLASQQQQAKSELEALREADEEERARRLQHEEWTREEILKLSQGIAKNLEKLEKVKVELTVTQDEMKDGFSEQCKQMQLDYDNLSHHIAKEKRARENDFVQLSEDMKKTKSVNNTGVFIWRIDNVESALAKATSLHGKIFSSEPNAYVLQPKIFLDGARPEDKGYVSVFIRILRGPFDAILTWPFKKRVCFTLINQEERKGIKRDIEKILMPVADAEELRRPSEDANNGFGIYKFVSHKMLRGERYIVDHVMFIKIEILEDVQQNGHSETV